MGRRRKPGKRTPSGRLSRAGQPADLGTVEGRAHRAALINGADVILASTLPGILFARGHLDRPQYDAALRFRAVRAAVFGVPLSRHDPGNPQSDNRALARERAYAQMVRHLGEAQRGILVSVACFDQRPKWFRVMAEGRRPSAEDLLEHDLLVDGLKALARG